MSTERAEDAKPATTDLLRAAAVLLTAVGQFVVGSLGGTGAIGESVGTVARTNDTPILPGGAAFGIWSLIYLGILALAVYQLLPRQQVRELHRRTGWWLVAAAIANAGWVFLYSARLVYVAQVVIVALLACLAVVLHRLAGMPARSWQDRVLVYAPLMLYAGWVSVATVVGAASTGVAAGLPGSGAGAVAAGSVVLLLTAAIAVLIVRAARAVVPFAAAVVWALTWIALADAGAPITVCAVVAAVVVVAAGAVRIRRDRVPVAAAFG